MKNQTPTFMYWVRLGTANDPRCYLAGFAYKDSAEKWARQQRDKINRDNKKGPLYRWSIEGVLLVKIEDNKERPLTEYLTDEAIAKSEVE
jgi:hypothetical protein